MKPALFAIVFCTAFAHAASERFNPLKPYSGPSVHGVDSSTLTDKVMTGYQGWFNCEGANLSGRAYAVMYDLSGLPAGGVTQVSADWRMLRSLKNEFLWSQFVAARTAGARMIYVAMFDEVDEGTAIFKCTNDLPAGPTRFLDYEGLPSDHYLWLTGQGAAMLRGKLPLQSTAPKRTP